MKNSFARYVKHSEDLISWLVSGICIISESNVILELIINMSCYFVLKLEMVQEGKSTGSNGIDY